MRTIITILGLLLVTACGSGDSEEVCEIATGVALEGDISAEVHSESSEVITGNISISGNTGFEAQNATKGQYGTFSLSVDGGWQYQITNSASDFTSPEEAFTVKACDGAEYQVNILVKGLFQREAYSGGYETALFNANGAIVYPEGFSYEAPLFDKEGNQLQPEQYPFAVAINDLFDANKLATIIANLSDMKVITYDQQERKSASLYFNGVPGTNSVPFAREIYLYNEFGNLTDESWYDLSYSDILPYRTYSYQNEYQTGKLESFLSAENRYVFSDTGERQKERTLLRQYEIIDGISTNLSLEDYRYDVNGNYESYNQDNPYHNLSFTFEYGYNALGQQSEVYKSFTDTDFRNIVDEIEDVRLLSNQYFYNDSGELDYELQYRTSASRLFEGVWRKTQYYYDDYGRQSHQVNYSASAQTNSEGVEVYGELSVSSSYPITLYNEELDVEIGISMPTDPSDFALTESIDSVFIKHFEDVDYCDGTFASNCRIKIEATSTAELPQVQ